MSTNVEKTNQLLAQLLDAAMGSNDNNLQQLAKQIQDSHKSLLSTIRIFPPVFDATANITALNTTRPTRPSHQSLAPTALFRLPPEIRHMIYKYLIPPPKAIRAASFHRPTKPEFYTGNHLLQPILAQLCAETRAFILNHGTYIFNKSDTESGLWWNPKHDVLVFEQEWWCSRESDDDDYDRLPPSWCSRESGDEYARLPPSPIAAALSGLRGLEHVRHVAVDAALACHLGYEIHFGYENRAITSLLDIPDAQSERDVSRVELVVFGIQAGTRCSTRGSHIQAVRGDGTLSCLLDPRLFTSLQSLNFVFRDPQQDESIRERVLGHESDSPDYFGNGRHSVHFNLGETDLPTARHQLGRLKELWRSWEVGWRDGRLYHDYVNTRDKRAVLSYYEKPGGGGLEEPFKIPFTVLRLLGEDEDLRESFDKELGAEPWEDDDDPGTDADEEAAFEA